MTDTRKRLALIGAGPMGLAAAKLLVEHGIDFQGFELNSDVGGLWDIGDTHVNVPWDEIDFRAGGDGIAVPVMEETVDDYTDYPDEMIARSGATEDVQPVGDDPLTGERVWRATELIGDYTRIREEDGPRNYGYVDDIIVRDGEVQAVMVRPSTGWGTPGVYGYPYYGYDYGWQPGLPYYDLPYGREDVATMDPVDYDTFE